MKLFDHTLNNKINNSVEPITEHYNLPNETYYQNLLKLNEIENCLEKESIIYSIEDRLINEKIGSERYKVTLEVSSLYLKEICNNIGIPSLETFDNGYTRQEGHEIVLEGLGDALRKIWEAIKNFFISLFKAIRRFFKAMVGSDEVINKKVTKAQNKIDYLVSNYPNASINKVINSKLPSMFFDDINKSIGDIEFFETSKEKINTLLKGMDNTKVTSLKGLNTFINKDASILLDSLKLINEDSSYDFSISDSLDKERDIYIPALETYLFPYVLDSSLMKNYFKEEVNGSLEIKKDSDLTLLSLYPEVDGKFNTPNEVNIVLGYYLKEITTGVREYSFKTVVLNTTGDTDKVISESELQVPSTVPNLKTVIDFFESYNSKVNVEELDKVIDSIGKSILKLTYDIEKNIKERTDVNKMETYKIATVTIKAPVSIIRHLKLVNEKGDEETNKLNNILMTLSIGEFPDTNSTRFKLTNSLTIKKKDVSVNAQEGTILIKKGTLSDGSDLIDGTVIYMNRHVSLFMKSYLTSLTSTMNIYSTKLLKMHLDIKAAYVDYITNSLDLYFKALENK